jgi:6-phospho-beta-glucosidase
MDGDANVRVEGNDAWNKSGIGWNVVPWGLRNVTTWIAREYDMPIYVTENGYGAQESEGLDDYERLWYYRAYINELLKSIRLDGKTFLFNLAGSRKKRKLIANFKIKVLT